MAKKVDPNSTEGVNRNMSRALYFKNYDYGEDKPSEVSPGAGIFGDMGKYKSVKEFLDKKRKSRKVALDIRMNYLICLAEIVNA
jgi:hypothetical protein